MEHTFMVLLLEIKKDEGFKDYIRQALKDHAPDDNERNRIEQVKEEMQQLYCQLYDSVEEGEKHDGDPNKIKAITDEIVELQNRLMNLRTENKRVMKRKKT